MFHAGACRVFWTVFSTHRHPANTNPAHPVSVSIRHPSDKSSAVTTFETDIYLRRKCNKIPGTYAVHTHACGVWVVSLEHGGGALGIFKSPVFALTIKHKPSSASHYFSVLSKRSGRRMPPAERSALYYILHLVFYIVQYHYCICLVEAGLLPARFMANRHRSTRRSRATAPVDLKPLKYLIL